MKLMNKAFLIESKTDWITCVLYELKYLGKVEVGALSVSNILGYQFA